MLSPYPLASILWEQRLQLVDLLLLSHPESLAEAKEVAQQGELSGASFLQAALFLLPLRGGRHGNTEGLGRGSSEPQLQGQQLGPQGRPKARATTLKARGPKPCYG